MVFFSTKSAGWIILICSIVILCVTISGAIANGINDAEAKDALIRLVGGGLAGCGVGAVMIYFFGRKK